MTTRPGQDQTDRSPQGQSPGLAAVIGLAARFNQAEDVSALWRRLLYPELAAEGGLQPAALFDPIELAAHLILAATTDAGLPPAPPPDLRIGLALAGGPGLAGAASKRLRWPAGRLHISPEVRSVWAALEWARLELAGDGVDLALIGSLDSTWPTQEAQSRGRAFQAGGASPGLALGGGVVALARCESALREGLPGYALIKSLGRGRAAEDAWPAVDRGALVAALKEAYGQAGLAPRAVELIEVEGVGQLESDRVELGALSEVFGPRQTVLPSCGLGSVASILGHNPICGGAAALIKLCLALHHRVLLATICQPIDPELRLEESVFYLNTRSRPWFRTDPEAPRRAGLTGIEPGGGAYHLVLEETKGRPATQAHQPDISWPSELILISADSRDQLLSSIDRLRARLAARPQEPIAHLANSLAARQPGQERLAIVAADGPELLAKLEAALAKLAQPERRGYHSRQGIDFGRVDPAEEKGETVWLFPGQGIQNLNMLLDLSLHFPVLRRWFEELNRAASDPLTLAPTSLLFPPPNGLTQAGEAAIAAHRADTASGNLATFVASLGLTDLLGRLGGRGGTIVGYSNGENAALYASGMLNMDRAEIMALSEQVASILAGGPKGVSVAVTAENKAALEEVLIDFVGQVYWAMDNCPHQVVFFGPEEAMIRAVKRLRAREAICLTLPFTQAYHTPLFAGQAALLRPITRQALLAPGQARLYSCLTARPFPDEPEAVVETIVGQWTHRVRFQETIEQLYAQGFQTFIEVGPGNQLTSFVDDILRGRVHLALPTALPDRSGLAQIQRLVGQLFVRGLEIDPKALFAGRGLSLVDLDREFAAASPAQDPTPKTAGRPRPPEPIRRPEGLTGRARQAALAAHFSLMQDFLASQERVLVELVRSRQKRAIEPGLGAEPVEVRGAWPLLDRIVWQTKDKLSLQRRLGPASDPYLLDHAFGRQVSARQPQLTPLAVLPLAVTMELMAEAAAALTHGRLAVIGLRQVRGARWLALDQGQLEVGLEAHRQANDPASVQVRVFDLGPVGRSKPRLAASGTVLLAERLPPPPAPRLSRPSDESAGQWTAEEFYQVGLFHGPLFRGVQRFLGQSQEGVAAEVGAWPGETFLSGAKQPTFQLPVVALDCIGQMVGYWFACQGAGQDFGLFPFALKAFDRFEAPWPADEPLVCRAAITADGRIATSHFEFSDASGRLTGRVEGFQQRCFNYPPAFKNHFVCPEAKIFSSEPWPTRDGLIVRRVRAFEPDFLGQSESIWLRVLAHLVLAERERVEFYALPDQKRPQWLLGRLAVKDAVRQWAKERLDLVLSPADVRIEPEPSGRPKVVWDEPTPPPAVSLSHCRLAAVGGAAGPGEGLGLDLESFAARKPGQWLESAFSPQELALVPAGDRAALLALWSAKEAAAKALSLGLGGRPLDWKVIARSPAGDKVTINHDGRSCPVELWPDRDEILAVCLTPAEGS